MERTLLIIVLAVVVLGIHIIIVTGLGLGLRKVLPLLIEESLQLDTRQVDGRTSGIEVEAIANHEFEIREKRLGGGVFVAVQLLPHRRKVHRFLDDLRVRWNIQGNPVYEE